MQRVWKFIYLGGAVLCAFGGYSSLAPERTAHTNADWILVILSFVMMCFFPLVAVAYSRRIGVEVFRRPSLNRQPLGWWSDPLQPLRISLVFIGVTFVGACFALPKADHRGIMITWCYGAMTLGLFIGERLVYRVHEKRIT